MFLKGCFQSCKRNLYLNSFFDAQIPRPVEKKKQPVMARFVGLPRVELVESGDAEMYRDLFSKKLSNSCLLKGSKTENLKFDPSNFNY